MVGEELVRGFAGVTVAFVEIYQSAWPLPSALLDLSIALDLVDDWFSLPPESFGLGDSKDARFVDWLAWCISLLFMPTVRSSIYLSSLPLLRTVFFSLMNAAFVCVKSEVASTSSVSSWSHVCGESISHIIRSSSDWPSTATALFG